MTTPAQTPWTLAQGAEFVASIAKAARDEGYLLSLYGSTLRGRGRDLDLLAVPWRAPTAPALFVDRLASWVGGRILERGPGLLAAESAAIEVDRGLVDVQVRAFSPPSPAPLPALGPDDVLTGPQDLAGLARLLSAQPKVESLDHLLDATASPAPEPRQEARAERCLGCGEARPCRAERELRAALARGCSPAPEPPTPEEPREDEIAKLLDAVLDAHAPWVLLGEPPGCSPDEARTAFDKLSSARGALLAALRARRATK